MSCPKCGHSASPEATECDRCGVVFAKLHARSAPSRDDLATLPADPPASASLNRQDRIVFVARALTVAGLALWTWRFARAPIGTASVLHLPNLVFHEAGHVLFSPFGRFMTVLGGSLFQFLVPLILAGALLRQGDRFGAAVCAWWAGQNLLDVAPYIADARALQLVLLGGRTGAEVEGHDWEYLLATLGWLRFDRALGAAAYRSGLAMMIAAIAWATTALRAGRKESQTSAFNSRPSSASAPRALSCRRRGE